MRASKVSDEQIWQLIKDRMDECGITVIDIAEQDAYLAQTIKRGITGYTATIKDDELYRCAQLLGLITHRHASGQIPSRDELIALLRYATPRPRQSRPVDWGCNGEH